MLATQHCVISLLCKLNDNDQVPWGWLPPHRLPASYTTAPIVCKATADLTLGNLYSHFVLKIQHFL